MHINMQVCVFKLQYVWLDVLRHCTMTVISYNMLKYLLNWGLVLKL